MITNLAKPRIKIRLLLSTNHAIITSPSLELGPCFARPVEPHHLFEHHESTFAFIYFFRSIYPTLKVGQYPTSAVGCYLNVDNRRLPTLHLGNGLLENGLEIFRLFNAVCVDVATGRGLGDAGVVRDGVE